MATPLESLIRAALDLEEPERLALAEAILDSVEGSSLPRPVIDEALKRLSEVRRGAAPTLSLDEMRARLLGVVR